MVKQNLDQLNILTADKGYDYWYFAKGCGPKVSTSNQTSPIRLARHRQQSLAK